jgi:hypothetical protein
MFSNCHNVGLKVGFTFLTVAKFEVFIVVKIHIEVF